MTELSRVLHTFVEHPIAAPRSIDDVVAGSRRVRARRRLTQIGGAATAVAFVVALGATLTGDDDPSATVVLGGGHVQHAGFIATEPGGYRGEGTWRLTITRGDESFVYSSATSPACGEVGTIRAGDEVRGEIRGADSQLKAGADAGC